MRQYCDMHFIKTCGSIPNLSINPAKAFTILFIGVFYCTKIQSAIAVALNPVMYRGSSHLFPLEFFTAKSISYCLEATVVYARHRSKIGIFEFAGSILFKRDGGHHPVWLGHLH